MRHLALNGGFTQVSNAFYPGSPRAYVDGAPHSVANSGLTLSDWYGFNSSLRYRHISGYILDGSDSTVPRATGLDVLDLSVSKRIRRGIDFNFAIDNLNNKHFWETQNYPELPGIPRGTTRSSEASSSWHSWQPHRPDGRVYFSDRREVAEKRESRISCSISG